MSQRDAAEGMSQRDAAERGDREKTQSMRRTGPSSLALKMEERGLPGSLRKSTSRQPTKKQGPHSYNHRELNLPAP